MDKKKEKRVVSEDDGTQEILVVPECCVHPRRQ
jgi:hypothetical protein